MKPRNNTDAAASEAAEPDVTQAEPTQTRSLDPETGRQLDEFGLPLSGPARARRLAEMGKPDPRTNPDEWGAAAPAAKPSAE